MSDINGDVLASLQGIEATLKALAAQSGLKSNFVQPKKNEAKKKTKGGKVYARVELPEGWKLIPGLNAIRTEGYNVAKAKSPKKDYGYWNREGLLRVEEALATM